MRIREARDADVPQLVEMGRAFRLGVYADVVAENVEQMTVTAQRLIDQPDSVVFVTESRGGDLSAMIGVQAFTHPLSGELTVGELFWWPVTGDGMRLLRHAILWARDIGATKFQTIQPVTEARVGDLYAGEGFRCIEAAWQLDLEAA